MTYGSMGKPREQSRGFAVWGGSARGALGAGLVIRGGIGASCWRGGVELGVFEVDEHAKPYHDGDDDGQRSDFA